MEAVAERVASSVTPPKFTRDAGNRLRYRGQGVRGKPNDLRLAVRELDLARGQLEKARDGLVTAAAMDDDRRRGDVVAEARADMLLAVRLARAAFKRQLPKPRPVPSAQLRLKLTRKGP